MSIDKFGRHTHSINSSSQGIDVEKLVDDKIKTIALINNTNFIDSIVDNKIQNISLSQNKSVIELVVDNKLKNISKPLNKTDIEIIVDSKLKNTPKSLNQTDVELIVNDKFNKTLNKSDIETIVDNKLKQFTSALSKTDIELLFDNKLKVVDFQTLVKPLWDKDLTNIEQNLKLIADTAKMNKNEIQKMRIEMKNILDEFNKKINDLTNRINVISTIQAGAPPNKHFKPTDYYSTDFIALEGKMSKVSYKNNEFYIQLNSGLTDFYIPEDVVLKSIPFMFPPMLGVYIDGKKIINPAKTVIGMKLKKGQRVVLTHNTQSWDTKILVTLLVNVPITDTI